MPLLLLLDIGNTHTHLGLANPTRILRQTNIRTSAWSDGTAAAQVNAFVGRHDVIGAALCSVVPKATPLAVAAICRHWRVTESAF